MARLQRAVISKLHLNLNAALWWLLLARQRNIRGVIIYILLLQNSRNSAWCVYCVCVSHAQHSIAHYNIPTTRRIASSTMKFHYYQSTELSRWRWHGSCANVSALRAYIRIYWWLRAALAVLLALGGNMNKGCNTKCTLSSSKWAHEEKLGAWTVFRSVEMFLLNLGWKIKF